MKKPTLILLFVIWIGVFLAGLYAATHGAEPYTAYNSVNRDYNMETDSYQTKVVLSENMSMDITEIIDVRFLEYRHGIYRYIPYKGVIEGTGPNGELRRMPYAAETSLGYCSETVSDEKTSGNYVLRVGSADFSVIGPHKYTLEYSLKPRVMEKDFSIAYINLFPTGWQNMIPAGSRFEVSFPKEVPHEAVKLYIGGYGDGTEGNDRFLLLWTGNILSGQLLEDLPLGSGVTLYAQLPQGYFSGLATFMPVSLGVVICALAVLLVTLIMFFLFGRDRELIPSIQYQPPEGLDSAAVGYIIDGVVEDRDIISLILYWADQGYLTIEEKEKGNLVLHRTMKEFPSAQPKYARIFYQKLFGKGDSVEIKSLEKKTFQTIEAAKGQVKAFIQSKGDLYTSSSKACRVLSFLLCTLPLVIFHLVMMDSSYLAAGQTVVNIAGTAFVLIGCFLYSYIIDLFYVKSERVRTAYVGLGLGMVTAGISWMCGGYAVRMARREIPDLRPAFFIICLCALVCVVLTGFMKKRTDICLDWMGRLIGLRDFIETAELDRMKVLAEDNPEWFYHILPYAYVMGLSDIFAKKLEGLALPAPTWYVSDSHTGYTSWNYYTFHHVMMHDMAQATRSLTTPPPSSSGGSGKHGSGGFSGFSGGGGGFSGGGFGGGGGGSW